MHHSILTILTAIVLALLLVFSSVDRRQQQLFLAGEASYANNDFMAAMGEYTATIRLYLPFSDRQEQASKRLWEMADKAAQNGDTEHALIACRALHSSWSAVHWLFQPGDDWIKRCELKIATLLATRN